MRIKSLSYFMLWSQLGIIGGEVFQENIVHLHLFNPNEGLDTKIDCYEGETVLDAAERNGLELPYSCLNGGCFMCAAMLEDGQAKMGDQFMLDDKHAEAGFRLLCCTTVSTDCEILTHQNDRLDF